MSACLTQENTMFTCEPAYLLHLRALQRCSVMWNVL